MDCEFVAPNRARIRIEQKSVSLFAFALAFALLIWPPRFGICSGSCRAGSPIPDPGTGPGPVDATAGNCEDDAEDDQFGETVVAIAANKCAIRI